MEGNRKREGEDRFIRLLTASRKRARRVEAAAAVAAAGISPSRSVSTEEVETRPPPLQTVEFLVQGRLDRDTDISKFAAFHAALPALVKPNATSSGAPAVMWRELLEKEQDDFASLGEDHIDDPKDMNEGEEAQVGGGGIHIIEGHLCDFFLCFHFRFSM
jgi:hypothetical protein